MVAYGSRRRAAIDRRPGLPGGTRFSTGGRGGAAARAPLVAATPASGSGGDWDFRFGGARRARCGAVLPPARRREPPAADLDLSGDAERRERPSDRAS